MRAARLSPFVFACALASLAISGARATEIQAGPIWNNMDAQGKCPGVCQQNGNSRWNGQWRTLPGTAASVCDCVGGMSPVNPQRASQWVEAGPLWNNMDAQNRCPGVCKQSGGRNWDGNWNTTQPGVMSVCSCTGQSMTPIMPPTFGSGASCSAQSRGACSGCSVQCAPGQRAYCQEGTTWNDKFGNGDLGCVSNAQCTCG